MLGYTTISIIDIEAATELRFKDFAREMTRQERYTIPPTARRGAAATVIVNFTILLMIREVLGGLAVRDLLTTRGSEENTVEENVLEGLAALQLDDVGTATRAVIRATTSAPKEARPTAKSTLPTETEAGTRGAQGDGITNTGAPEAGISRTSSADNATSTGLAEPLSDRDGTLTKGPLILDG